MQSPAPENPARRQTSPAKRPRPLKLSREVEKSVGRQGARFGGNANNGNCSPRYVNGNNYVGNANRNNGGFAEVELKIIFATTTYRGQKSRTYKTSTQVLAATDRDAEALKSETARVAATLRWSR